MPSSYNGNPYGYFLKKRDGNFLKRSLKNVVKPPTKEQNIIRDILIGIIVTVIGGIILWLIVR